jgi:hypothetical protein
VFVFHAVYPHPSRRPVRNVRKTHQRCRSNIGNLPSGIEAQTADRIRDCVVLPIVNPFLPEAAVAGLKTSSPWPTYGPVGKRETSQTEYRRVLRLDIVDKQDFAEGNIKKVYEGRVVSSGFSDKLDKVLPKMVKALFEDFPGQSGSTKTLFQPTDNAAVFDDFL